MQDYAITDFSGGLLTNAAYHPGRNKSAQYVRDNRVDEQGWLIPRKGRIRISDEQNVTEIFVHKTILLAVINGYLKWTRLQDDNEPLIFHDFFEGGYLIKAGSERVVFHKVDDDVYIGTGKASFVVNVPDIPNVPTVQGFHLPQPQFEYSYVNQPGGQRSQFWVKAQFIRTDGTVADVNDLNPTDAIRIAEANVVSAPSEARYVDANDANTRTIIQMRVEGAGAGLVDYVDFFRTERDAEENSEYYWFFRVPYRPANQVNPLLISEHSFAYTETPRVSVNWSIPFDDNSPTNTLGPAAVIDSPLLNRDELLKVNDDQVDFQHFASNAFRNYAAEPNSNRVWFSYYDPADNLSLRRNFTDFINLDLGGGQITGLHFLRDTFLYVYATNQIQVISTDPIAELHQVVDFIKPRDEKGEVIGCAAPDSIVNILGRHYFFATNQRAYRFDGQRLYDFSDRVHGEFQKVLTETEDGQIQLQPIIGYAINEDYFLSVPMSIPDVDDVEYPNMQMVYDVSHGVWWQDSYGVRSASKSAYRQTYGVIDGELCLLHFGDTDAGVTIRRKWRGHPFLTTTQKAWESVHVHPLTPCRVDVIARTEQDEKQGYLDIQNIAIFDQKRMGCNLRGLTQTIEIQTDSLATVHRIAINERPRNR